MLGNGKDDYHRSTPWTQEYVFNILYVLGVEGGEERKQHGMYSKFLAVMWSIFNSTAKDWRETSTAFRVPHANNRWAGKFKVHHFKFQRSKRPHFVRRKK
jgi:hypothetical protein